MYLTPGERVFAIVLNFQRSDDTFRCITALQRSSYRNLFPVVVDNASGGNTLAKLSDALGPTMTIIPLEENRGYAGGNNVGIRYALERDADFVWLLNPDTEPEPDALAEMLRVARSSASIGAVGSLNITGPIGEPTVHFAGGVIDWDTGVPESMAMGSPMATVDASRPYDVDYVAGSSMLLRRGLIADIGPIPEEYFLYFEETDYLTRAREAGWRVTMAPKAVVRHHYRSGSGLPAPYYVYYYIRGRLLFASKYEIGDTASRLVGLDVFVDGWRKRVSKARPSWVATYDNLVKVAIEDGVAGRTGRRDDIHDVAPAGAGLP